VYLQREREREEERKRGEMGEGERYGKWLVPGIIAIFASQQSHWRGRMNLLT
jgi:hypothetical protein